jgi:hypothetical protein
LRQLLRHVQRPIENRRFSRRFSLTAAVCKSATVGSTPTGASFAIARIKFN